MKFNQYTQVKSQPAAVAPLAGAWIETRRRLSLGGGRPSRPSRARGLKLLTK